jgi:hypothetical protein
VTAETGVEVPSTLACTGTKTLASFTDVTVGGKAIGSLNPTAFSGGDPNTHVSPHLRQGLHGDLYLETVTCT